MFGFVQGVYAGETIINVWGEPEVFLRGTWTVLADGKWDGVPVTGGSEDAEATP